MSEVAKPTKSLLSKGWSRFSNGTPYPYFCWPSPFGEKIKTHETLSQRGVAVVAIGELPHEVTDARYGGAEPIAVAKALGRVISGGADPNSLDRDAFSEAYETLITKATGSGKIDVLVLSLGDSPDSVGAVHFGSRNLGELAEPLHGLSATLLSEAGVSADLELSQLVTQVA